MDSIPAAMPEAWWTRSRRRALDRVTPPNRFVEGIAALFGYTVLAGLLYRTPILSNPGTTAAGLGLPDNYAYIWMLGWPAHAIGHGLGLFHPDLVFAPAGFNLARATPMFTSGVLLAPLTAIAGPVVTYNVVMLAVPALNGSSAYVLCRRVGAGRASSALGGFVFAVAGFVSFAELGQPTTGCALFVVLAILLMIDLLDRRRASWGRAILLGLDLVAQLYTSSEMLTTFLLFGGLALIVTWWLDPSRRGALRAVLPKLAASGGIFLAGGLPYLLAFVFDSGAGLSHANPDRYPNDLLSFVIPTPLDRIGRAHFSSLVARFPNTTYFPSLRATLPGETAEAYIGIGLVVITVWSLAERWRTQVGVRVLGVMLAVVTVSSLGTHLTIAGHSIIPLPWAIVRHLPLLRYAIPSRLSVYLALGVAVALALWLKRRPGPLRWALALASCALLIPNPSLQWATPLRTPRFFTAGTAARMFSASDRVMVLPFASRDDEDQAESGYAFSLVGGYLGEYPISYGRFPAATYLAHGEAPSGAVAEVARFVRAKGTDAVVVERTAPGPWRQLLSGLGVEPIARQGVLIYLLRR